MEIDNITAIFIMFLVACFVLAVFMFIGINQQYQDCLQKGLIGIQTGNGVVCVSNKAN